MLVKIMFVEIGFCNTNQIVVVFPSVILQIVEDREQIEEQHVVLFLVSLCPCATRPPLGRSLLGQEQPTTEGERAADSRYCSYSTAI